MMNSNQALMYRRMLLTLRSHLRHEMDLLVDVAHDFAIDRPRSRPAEVCRACRPTWRTVVAGIVGACVNELVLRKEQMLDRIDDALERLDDGSYGLCWECDAQISEAWLATVPYADRCTHCDSQHELEQRIP
jgi:hypothetical protein